MSFYSLTNPTDCISFSSQLSATQRNFNVSGAGPTISLLLRMASWPPSAPNANADILKVSRMRLKLAAGDPPSHSKSTSVSKHIADIPSGPSMMNAFVKRFSLFHLLASIICWVGDKDCSAPKPARIFAMCSSSKENKQHERFWKHEPQEARRLPLHFPHTKPLGRNSLFSHCHVRIFECFLYGMEGCGFCRAMHWCFIQLQTHQFRVQQLCNTRMMMMMMMMRRRRRRIRTRMMMRTRIQRSPGCSHGLAGRLLLGPPRVAPRFPIYCWFLLTCCGFSEKVALK